MLKALLGAAVIILAIGIGWVTRQVRGNMLSSRAALAATGVCLAGLIAMVLTDWPLEVLNRFWADHSVVAGVLSSLLLVGVVFLAYERGEQHRQQELANGLSGAGLGGIVDHIIDVEVALALVSRPNPPDQIAPQIWAGWDKQGKPLRWLREGREILSSDEDPRRVPLIGGDEGSLWAQELVDQAIRRLLAAMRDWTPLIGASQDGTTVLLLLSKVRADLMVLQDLQHSESDPAARHDRSIILPMLVSIRLRLRVFAICFEDWSGASKRRLEVLNTVAPLPNTRPVFEGVSQPLTARLNKACNDLGL